MFLYLVQHAEAKREEEDPSRGLSGKGRQDIRKVASHAAKLNLKLSQIFHSGKTRALQTAEVLAGNLKPEKGISQTDGIAPLDDPRIWGERLKGMREDIMLVGHLPHLGKLASLLISGDPERNIVSFKMAGIICLKRDEGGNWFLQWMITPDIVI
ncbi:MAG: phosphohistidine phosphatase SixA [Nitrospirota bacterium]